MQETLHAILDQLHGLARFRWWGMLAAWAVCVGGWAIVMVLPSKYESTARVFADTTTALSPVIEGIAIQQDMTAQLNLVEQSLLGEAQLDRVINETGFDTRGLSARDRTKLRDRLRSDITVTMEPSGKVGRSGAPASGMVYSLAYLDVDRDRSLKVVKMLLDAFVNQTLGGNLQDSEAAQKFLTERIQEYEKRLRDAEQRLATFKKRNIGKMPGAEGGYFARLQAEMDAAHKARSLLSVAVSRRDELDRQLKDGTILATAAGGASTQTLTLPGGRTISGGDTMTQLSDAEAKLNALLQTYTEKHPEVVELRARIIELKARREQDLAALRRGDQEALMSSGVTSNPIYQSVRLALNQADVEVAALRRELSDHESKITELRKAVNTVPEVEAEFARLNRDYDLNRAQYLSLIERLEKARMGQNADEVGSGIRFDVINPPTASFRPVSPKRPLLTAAVFAAGVGIGLVLAFVLHKLNPVFNRARELEERTGLPVFGTVSLTTLNAYLAATRNSYRKLAAAAAGLLLAFAVALLISLGVSNPLA